MRLIFLFSGFLNFLPAKVAGSRIKQEKRPASSRQAKSTLAGNAHRIYGSLSQSCPIFQIIGGIYARWRENGSGAGLGAADPPFPRETGAFPGVSTGVTTISLITFRDNSTAPKLTRNSTKGDQNVKKVAVQSVTFTYQGNEDDFLFFLKSLVRDYLTVDDPAKLTEETFVGKVESGAA